MSPGPVLGCRPFGPASLHTQRRVGDDQAGDGQRRSSGSQALGVRIGIALVAVDRADRELERVQVGRQDALVA